MDAVLEEHLWMMGWVVGGEVPITRVAEAIVCGWRLAPDGWRPADVGLLSTETSVNRWPESWSLMTLQPFGCWSRDTYGRRVMR
jgi:hypothetical protein